MSLYRFFAKASKRSDLSDPSGPLSASRKPVMLALSHTAHKCKRYQLRMHTISRSKQTKLKNAKIILRVFWSIIRKLAPMKISHYTVSSGGGSYISYIAACIAAAWSGLQPGIKLLYMCYSSYESHEKSCLQVHRIMV